MSILPSKGISFRFLSKDTGVKHVGLFKIASPEAVSTSSEYTEARAPPRANSDKSVCAFFSLRQAAFGEATHVTKSPSLTGEAADGRH